MARALQVPEEGERSPPGRTLSRAHGAATGTDKSTAGEPARARRAAGGAGPGPGSAARARAAGATRQQRETQSGRQVHARKGGRQWNSAHRTVLCATMAELWNVQKTTVPAARGSSRPGLRRAGDGGGGAPTRALTSAPLEERGPASMRGVAVRGAGPASTRGVGAPRRRLRRLCRARGRAREHACCGREWGRAGEHARRGRAAAGTPNSALCAGRGGAVEHARRGAAAAAAVAGQRRAARRSVLGAGATGAGRERGRGDPVGQRRPSVPRAAYLIVTVVGRA